MIDTEIFWTHVWDALPTLLGAIAAYAAIRSDLAVLREKTRQNEVIAKEAQDRADAAHARIDRVLEK